MGKRERRRRRERLLAESLTPSISHRRDSRPAFVPIAGAPMGRDLAQLVTQQRALDQAVGDEIARLVDLGVSWPVIANALGVTRQAARQRWLRRRSAADGQSLSCLRQGLDAPQRERDGTAETRKVSTASALDELAANSHWDRVIPQ